MKPKGPRWNEEEREQGGHWWPFRYTYTHRPPVEATPLSSCWHKTHCVCVCCVSGARWDCESSWACFTCTLTHRGTGLSYKFDLKKHFFISHLSTMEVYVHIHLNIPDYILLLLCHNISRPYWVVQNFACFLIGLIYSEVQSVGVRLVYRPKLLRWPTRGNWRFFSPVAVTRRLCLSSSSSLSVRHQQFTPRSWYCEASDLFAWTLFLL